MVRCEQAESPALSAFLDGALPDEEQVALSAHLEGCRDCAAELAQLRGLDEALAGAVDADAGSSSAKKKSSSSFLRGALRAGRG